MSAFDTALADAYRLVDATANGSAMQSVLGNVAVLVVRKDVLRLGAIAELTSEAVSALNVEEYGEAPESRWERSGTQPHGTNVIDVTDGISWISVKGATGEMSEHLVTALLALLNGMESS